MSIYSDLRSRLANINVVPVVALTSVEEALSLGEALTNAGLNCIEVTFRTEQAAECIKALKEKYPSMMIAAGTVLTVEQSNTAIELGCDFVVSPAINPDVIRNCQWKEVPVIPGVCNPQQIEQGIALGLEILKFFPAEVFGGTKFLKSIASIYPVTFMPTGGIQASTWKDYLALPNVICCGGSWIANNELMASGQWQEVERSARATLL
jgi:2-dehydro-3-deoxyphosphogluconate aldolase/(4S)-4-hydroxy-2-oxoglutarate aldolase